MEFGSSTPLRALNERQPVNSAVKGSARLKDLEELVHHPVLDDNLRTFQHHHNLHEITRAPGIAMNLRTEPEALPRRSQAVPS